MIFFFFQAEDGIRDIGVTGVQTCVFRSNEKSKVQITMHNEEENKDETFAIKLKGIKEVKNDNKKDDKDIKTDKENKKDNDPINNKDSVEIKDKNMDNKKESSKEDKKQDKKEDKEQEKQEQQQI